MKRHLEISLPDKPVNLVTQISNAGGKPLLITCTDYSGALWFWMETNLQQVPIFLPHHPERVVVSVSEGGSILSVLVADLKPPAIPYLAEHETRRGYNISDFKFIPDRSIKGPAAMSPVYPEIRYNPDILKQYPIPVQEFIFHHEIAHYWFNTEKLADLWAMITHLNNGWGESMALYALNHVLHPSGENYERVEFAYDILKELDAIYYEY